VKLKSILKAENKYTTGLSR